MKDNKKYELVRVEIFPPQSEEFFQLYVGGKPSNVVFSSSHLKFCLHICELEFGELVCD